MDLAADLLSRGRRPSTKKSYAGKWRRFVRFCTNILPQVYGVRARKYLPATERTVLMYLCHLRAEGLVHECSLNPYLAAINQAHEDLGLPRPAVGHWTALLRRGFKDAEGEDFNEDIERTIRAPVPPEAIHALLLLGLNTDDTTVLRRCACIVLCYCWFNRADSGVLLLRRDVTIDARGITLNQHGKTIARNQACPVHRRHDARFDHGGLVLKLLQRWHSASAVWQSPDHHYWSLAGESQSASAWPAKLVTSWLNSVLLLVDMAPPSGEKWTGHSLRSGGASACIAIGVDIFHIMKHGVWKSLAAVQQYLSMMDLPTTANYIFFGWLLPRSPPLPLSG